MKNIKITYIKLADELKNCLVEVGLGYPTFEVTKQCYLYELFYFDTLESKITQREEELVQYGIINGDLAPFYIKIEDNIYKQLEDYLSQTTEYEECKWQDDVSLLNAILGVYRQDPKSWDI